MNKNTAVLCMDGEGVEQRCETHLLSWVSLSQCLIVSNVHFIVVMQIWIVENHDDNG